MSASESLHSSHIHHEHDGPYSRPKLVEEPADLRRHSKYYFDDELIVFLVESRLYRVHRYFLSRESPFFESMFSCPPSHDGPEGRDDQNPVLLPGVLCREFEALLDYFYHPIYHSKSRKTRTMSTDNLLDLLSISDRYDFEQVRQYAINALNPGVHKMEPMKRFQLADKYNVKDWLIPVYTELCQRKDPLKVQEATILGAEKTALVAQARESYRDSQKLKPRIADLHTWGGLPGSNYPGGTDIQDRSDDSTRRESIHRIVNDIFFPSQT